MSISFKKTQLKAVCENIEESTRLYGEDIAQKLSLTLRQLNALENMAQLKLLKSIEFIKNVEKNEAIIYTVDLTGGAYLLFVPICEDPYNESLIKNVEIKEILK